MSETAFMGIEGLSRAVGPQNFNQLRGRLDLPAAFDNKRFAAKWVKKGPDVTKARESSLIAGSKGTLTAAGWEVWKDPKTKQAHTRTLGNGVYVLLHRPMALQRVIQRMAGNVSKDRMVNEANGKTIAGAQLQDGGILPSERLNGVLGTEGEPLVVPMNPVDEDLQRATAVKVASRGSTKLK